MSAVFAEEPKIIELTKELAIYRDHSRGKSERTDVSLDSFTNANVYHKNIIFKAIFSTFLSPHKLTSTKS